MSMDVGFCDKCGASLRMVWYIEKERRNGILTGRERDAVSHLECPTCWKVFAVDDSFDGPWRRAGGKE